MPPTPSDQPTAAGHDAARDEARDAARAVGLPGLDAVFELAHDPLAVLDAAGTFRQVSHAWGAVLGFEPGDLLGRSFLRLVSPSQVTAARRWLERVATAGAPLRADLVCKTGRGSHEPLAWRGRPIAGGEGLVVVQVESLRHRRGHGGVGRDALTGLLDRQAFQDRLREVAARAREGAERTFAVALLDLDRFKRVNDHFGHAVGDAMLVEVAQRLRDSIRPGDEAARFGGDEFALLLQRLHGPSDAVVVAERIQRGLQQAIHVEGQELRTHASIGIALHRFAGEGPERLLRDADVAMYQAKARGIGRHAVFDDDLERSTEERQRLGAEIERALQGDEFRIHYQPRVRLATGRLCGFEALLRWQHPRHGLIRPDAFLQVAADTGRLVQVERRLFSDACRQLRAWQEGREEPLLLGVNLCESDLYESDLAMFLRDTLARNGLAVEQLQVEVTEADLLDHTSNSLRKVQSLQRLGVRIFIDDFGSGYSSLSVLHRFPVHGLKVDHAFVRQVPANAQATEIVRSIVVMGQSLGLEVVAEGVETPAQLDFLREIGCAYAEGPLFGEPADPADATRLLASDPTW